MPTIHQLSVSPITCSQSTVLSSPLTSKISRNTAIHSSGYDIMACLHKFAGEVYTEYWIVHELHYGKEHNANWSVKADSVNRRDRATVHGRHLHHGADGLSVSENFTQSLGAENVTQRRLSQQLSWPRGILDVDDWDTRIGDAIVNDSVHGYRHRVTRQNLIHPHTHQSTFQPDLPVTRAADRHK